MFQRARVTGGESLDFLNLGGRCSYQWLMIFGWPTLSKSVRLCQADPIGILRCLPMIGKDHEINAPARSLILDPQREIELSIVGQKPFGTPCWQHVECTTVYAWLETRLVISYVI